jgi:hypothetical protein
VLLQARRALQLSRSQANFFTVRPPQRERKVPLHVWRKLVKGLRPRKSLDERRKLGEPRLRRERLEALL